jgi:hypothetical protein
VNNGPQIIQPWPVTTIPWPRRGERLRRERPQARFAAQLGRQQGAEFGAGADAAARWRWQRTTARGRVAGKKRRQRCELECVISGELFKPRKSSDVDGFCSDFMLPFDR